MITNRSNSTIKLLPVSFVILAIVAVACTPQQLSHSEFKSLPITGWNATVPLHFAPLITDSDDVFNIDVAVRHLNSYPYSNLDLAIDMIDSTHHATRHMVHFNLADKFGDWTGSGFGSLYQAKEHVATGVKASQVKSVVVWHLMPSDKPLDGISEIGLILSHSH